MTKETKSVEEDIEELVKKNRMYFSQNYCDPDREEGWQSLWRMTENHLRQTLLSYRQQIAEELEGALEALEGKVIKKNDDIRLGNSRPLKERNMLMKKYNQALAKAQQIIRERLKGNK